MDNNYLKDLAHILKEIDDEICGGLSRTESKERSFEYSMQRKIISDIFGKADDCRCPMPYNIDMIIVRLRLIDSFYSTGGRYGSLTIEELAEDIYTGLGNSESGAADLFDKFVLNPDFEGKVWALFNGKYGIQKNLSDGARQVSLLSKYAFYQLLKYVENGYKLGFPIFDSMATKTYPKVCNLLDITPQKHIHSSMSKYVDAFRDLIKAISGQSGYIFKNQAFDVLDQYLWRIGKINSGSFTLLLDKTDYSQFIKNIGMNEPEDQKYMKSYNANSKSKLRFDDVVLRRCKCKDLGSDATVWIKNKLFVHIYEHWLTYFSRVSDIK